MGPQTHPDLQIILYISGSGGLMERMAQCSPDIISVDQRVDMRDAIARIGPGFAVQACAYSGSLPPAHCFTA
jgi:uroporphyrinogen decarboxylase